MTVLTHFRLHGSLQEGNRKTTSDAQWVSSLLTEYSDGHYESDRHR